LRENGTWNSKNLEKDVEEIMKEIKEHNEK